MVGESNYNKKPCDTSHDQGYRGFFHSIAGRSLISPAKAWAAQKCPLAGTLEKEIKKLSSEFYVQLFESGNEKLIDTKKVTEIIERRNFIKKDDYYEVIFDNENSTIINISSSLNQLSSITVSRPCLDKELGNLLFEIMALDNFILYAPEGHYPIVLYKKVISNLPEGMIETIGTPMIAKDKKEFNDLLEQIYNWIGLDLYGNRRS